MTQPRSLAFTALGLTILAIGGMPTSGTGQVGSSWPDYRGPKHDGHAPSAKVPLTWSEEENVTWKSPVAGIGWSSPVVFGDQVWLTSASAKGHEMSALAYDAGTGDKIFDRVLFENDSPEPKNALNSYASPSPTIERGRVYVHFGTYGTACIDTGTLQTLWKRRDIHCDHMEGPGSSPILFRDLLIVNMDGGDVQYVIALDTKTGDTRWKTDRTIDVSRKPPDLRKAYSTPVIVEVDGKPRLLSSSAGGTTAYDPMTGEELWKVRHTGFSMSARPIVDRGRVILNTGFMSARLLAVRTSGAGDVTEENIVWTYRRSVPKMSSGILVNGLLYLTSDTGIATCLDAEEGTMIWRERLGADYCASPLYASGHVFLFDRGGRTLVLKPGKKFEVVATNQLDEGFMASPAVVGDALILRSKTHLYRIESVPADKVPAGEIPAEELQAKERGWTRFRGPNGSGVAETKGLPVEFGPKKNLIWKTDLPIGHSSPVLTKSHVFLTGVDGPKLFTYCIERDTGKIAWQKEAPRPRAVKLDKRNNAASPTPAVDADIVVVFFEDFGLLAYDHTGEELWRTPLGPFRNEYGMGASPVLFEDRVFLACDQVQDSFLVAAAKEDGEILFKIPRPEAKSGHCTPIIFRPEKGNAQLILPGSFLLDAYDTQTGKRVWWVRGLSFEMKSTPVLHDGTIYINGYASPMNQPNSIIELPEFAPTVAKHDANKDGKIQRNELPKFRGSGMFFGFVDLDADKSLNATEWAFLRAALASKNGMMAIRAGGHGDMTEKSVSWTYHRGIPQLPSPLIYADVLYMLNDQSGLISTLRPADGSVIQRGRLKDAIDTYYASPVAGDGKIYCVSEHGLVTVLKPGGGLDALTVNDLGESCYATPALADGKIYLRTTSALYCFGHQD